MRKRLLSLLFLVGGVTVLGIQAQGVKVLSDLTSKIQNADFTADEPIDNTICTYDYDMANNATTYYGLQAVTGWTTEFLSDNVLVEGRSDGKNAKAAGIFAYRSLEDEGTPGLGSSTYLAPVNNKGYEGPGLGLVAVWGSDIKYTQDVTLPAGGYMLLVTIQNVAGDSEALLSNNGFTTADGTIYRSSKVAYASNMDATDGIWETDTILFRLKAETAGQLTLGYKSGNYGSGSAPHLFIDNVKLYQIEEDVFEQAEIKAAKQELLELIEIGEARNADVTESRTVYDNPNATLEEVLAAIEKQKALNESAVTDLSEFFILNPHFSMDEPIEDGITTYDYDMPDPAGANGKAVTHYGMQPVTNWVASTPSDNIQHMASSSDTGNDAGMNARASGVFAVGSNAFLGGAAFLPPTEMSDGSKEGKLLGFVSVWSAKSQYTQDVTIPAGRYTLTFSYYNGGGTTAVAKNLMGFVAEDGTEYLGTTTTFAVGKWLTESVVFELDEETSGYFTMGYTAANSGSAAMPHLFVDGISLIYVGTEIEPSLFALQAAVSGGEKALYEVFNADLKDKLEAAVSVGRDLVSSRSDDAEANKAATETLSVLMTEVNASIKAYAALNAFNENTLMPAIEKYDEKDYPELYAILTQLKDDVDDAYGDGTWTTEQIEKTIFSFTGILKEEIQKAWDAAVEQGEVLGHDIDISILFDQLAYTYSTTAASGANVPDKEWKYGDATNFKTQYGTAEVWNQSPFKVSRTLENLPAGKYTITTKAYFRNADNATNYQNYDPLNTPEAYLFAGGVKTGLTNVAAIASGTTADGWDDAGGVYVPNSQLAAYNVFNDEQYTDALEKSVSTVLVSDGSLTFGVGADEMQDNSWVVWYTFSVTYNAPDRNTLLDVLASLNDVAESLMYEDAVAYNFEADNKINDAQGEYDNVASLTEDELKHLVTQYEEAISYAEEAITLTAELTETYALYNDYLITAGNVDSEEPVYTQLLTDIAEAQSDGYESNKQIQGFIDGLKNGWAAYVQYPVLATSSEANPGNITPAIYNSSFVDPVTNENNANGWNIAYTGGSASGQHGVYEFYNNDSFEISQTINGLAEGYYRIRVQSFYRPGDNILNADTFAIDPGYGRYVQFFGMTENTNRFTSVKNVLERADEDGELSSEALGVGAEVAVAYGDVKEFYVPNDRESFVAYCEWGIYWNQVDVYVGEGESLTLGLRKNVHVASDWCPFDNFELYYLGTTAPTAIEDVEADGTHSAVPAAIYNLAGQRVQKAVKGLYIVNGKKVLVK